MPVRAFPMSIFPGFRCFVFCIFGRKGNIGWDGIPLSESKHIIQMFKFIELKLQNSRFTFLRNYKIVNSSSWRYWSHVQDFQEFIRRIFRNFRHVSEFLQKSWEMPDLGSAGSQGPICIVNCKKRVARKIWWIILRHFGLVTLTFNFGKNQNSFHFHDFRT